MTERASSRGTPATHNEVITLRDYVDTRMASVLETMAATDRSMEIRLEAMNELRDQINRERGSFIQRTEHDAVHKALDDERSTYIHRSEHDAVHKSLDGDIRTLREHRAEIQGKASITAVYFTAFCVVISLVISVAALVRSFY